MGGGEIVGDGERVKVWGGEMERVERWSEGGEMETVAEVVGMGIEVKGLRDKG